MNSSTPDNHENSEIEEAACKWISLLDRGLTPEEQDEYMSWLAADSKHREAMRFYQWSWDEFDRLAGLQNTNHALEHIEGIAHQQSRAESNRGRNKLAWLASSLAIAASVVMAFLLWPDLNEREAIVSNQQETISWSRIERLALDDGSLVEVNRGALVESSFSASERRVRLIRGEANFTVAKDFLRPFIVEAAGASIRAVGTEFNVRLTEDLVDVTVSEGKVSFQSSAGGKVEATSEEFLSIGQQARMLLDSETLNIEVSSLAPQELEEKLNWQPTEIDLDAMPLSEIIEELNQRNPIKISLGNPSLGSMKLSGFLWSDDVLGFVDMMRSLEMEAKFLSPSEVILN